MLLEKLRREEHQTQQRADEARANAMTRYREMLARADAPEAGDEALAHELMKALGISLDQLQTDVAIVLRVKWLAAQLDGRAYEAAQTSAEELKQRVNIDRLSLLHQIIEGLSADSREAALRILLERTTGHPDLASWERQKTALDMEFLGAAEAAVQAKRDRLDAGKELRELRARHAEVLQPME